MLQILSETKEKVFHFCTLFALHGHWFNSLSYTHHPRYKTCSKNGPQCFPVDPNCFNNKKKLMAIATVLNLLTQATMDLTLWNEGARICMIPASVSIFLLGENVASCVCKVIAKLLSIVNSQFVHRTLCHFLLPLLQTYHSCILCVHDIFKEIFQAYHQRISISIKGQWTSHYKRHQPRIYLPFPIGALDRSQFTTCVHAYLKTMVLVRTHNYIHIQTKEGLNHFTTILWGQAWFRFRR